VHHPHRLYLCTLLCLLGKRQHHLRRRIVQTRQQVALVIPVVVRLLLAQDGRRGSLCFPDNHHRTTGTRQNCGTTVPPIRALRPQADSVTRHPSVLLPCVPANINHHRVYSQRAVQPPKFSTAPYPTSPPLTTTSPTSKRRHESIQDLNSPMGNAINDYFRSASPPTDPPAPSPATMPVSLPAAASLSAHRQRNLQVLSPANTLRMQRFSPTHPTHEPSPHDVMRNDLFLPRDSIIMAKSSRSSRMPAVQDVRNSPRIVVRDLS
jgi:hypothetical protein